MCFKQRTAYAMRIRDGSSDVCSSDLPKAEGKAAPPNITSRATPVATPTPIIPLPVPPVVVTSIKPFEGPDPTQGNADIRGPGTGVGGIGDGTGSGGRGDGGGAGDRTSTRLNSSH